MKTGKRNKVYRLLKQGLSLHKISRQVGISFQRVSQIANSNPNVKSRHRIYTDVETISKNGFYRTQAELVLSRLKNGYTTIKGDRLFGEMKIMEGNFWFGVTYPVSSEPERYYMSKGKRMPVPNDYPWGESFIFI